MIRTWLIIDISRTKAIEWGKKNEKTAIKAFEKKYGGKIENCGLFVSKQKPNFAASPDGIYQDTLIEVKCPYMLRDSSPTDWSKLKAQQKSSFCCVKSSNGDDLILKKTHQYYVQVQMQMYCSGYQKTYFVV